MIDRKHALPLAIQARLLGIARSTVYRDPEPVPAADLAVMRRIDELHLDHPVAGSRVLLQSSTPIAICNGKIAELNGLCVIHPVQKQLCNGTLRRMW